MLVSANPGCRPIGLLFTVFLVFTAFVGFDPIQQLLPSAEAAPVSGVQYAYLTEWSFWSHREAACRARLTGFRARESRR